MPYITSSDGPKIWYDALGEGEVLFLIGGSSLVRRQWDFMVPFLQDRFRVILYDQRGRAYPRDLPQESPPRNGLTI